jgi:hypothetical protein
LNINGEVWIANSTIGEASNEFFDVFVVDEASKIFIQVVEKVSGSVCGQSLRSKDADALTELVDV